MVCRYLFSKENTRLLAACSMFSWLPPVWECVCVFVETGLADCVVLCYVLKFEVVNEIFINDLN